MSYEHANRKYTYKLMAADGRPFGVTLAKACKDATVKECNFTTPLALHAKRPHPNPPLIPFKGDKGKGRGRGRGGKLLTKTTNTANRTHETKPVCFRYNAKGGCKKGDMCRFAHVCLRCFAKHPATQCPTLKTKTPDDKKPPTN